MALLFSEESLQNFPAQPFSPNFETKHYPTAQHDSASKTSASCCTPSAEMTTADSVTA